MAIALSFVLNLVGMRSMLRAARVVVSAKMLDAPTGRAATATLSTATQK